MTDHERDELFYDVERYIAESYAETEKGSAPYIQEGDVEDVVTAIEALGYKIVKA